MQDLYTARLRALNECCSATIAAAEAAAAAAGCPGELGCVKGPHWRALLGSVGLNLGHAEEVLGLCLPLFRAHFPHITRAVAPGKLTQLLTLCFALRVCSLPDAVQSHLRFLASMLQNDCFVMWWGYWHAAVVPVKIMKLLCSSQHPCWYAVDTGLAWQVLRVMQECFNLCVRERQPLHGFGSLLRLGKGSELQLAIRMVEPQFDQVTCTLLCRTWFSEIMENCTS